MRGDEMNERCERGEMEDKRAEIFYISHGVICV